MVAMSVRPARAQPHRVHAVEELTNWRSIALCDFPSDNSGAHDQEPGSSSSGGEPGSPGIGAGSAGGGASSGAQPAVMPSATVNNNVGIQRHMVTFLSS
jgi:hypothetical protein